MRSGRSGNLSDQVVQETRVVDGDLLQRDDVGVEIPQPGYLVVEGGEVWTTVKLMRRLAWHERSELETMQVMLSQLRR